MSTKQPKCSWVISYVGGGEIQSLDGEWCPWACFYEGSEGRVFLSAHPSFHAAANDLVALAHNSPQGYGSIFIEKSSASDGVEPPKACAHCGGKRFTVADHGRYGPEVIPCPDCYFEED